jgi:hypothetical protein
MSAVAGRHRKPSLRMAELDDYIVRRPRDKPPTKSVDRMRKLRANNVSVPEGEQGPLSPVP